MEHIRDILKKEYWNLTEKDKIEKFKTSITEQVKNNEEFKRFNK